MRSKTSGNSGIVKKKYLDFLFYVFIDLLATFMNKVSDMGQEMMEGEFKDIGRLALLVIDILVFFF